jgi:streptopain
MNIRNFFFMFTLLSIIATGCGSDKEFLSEDDFFITADEAERIAERIAASLPDNEQTGELIIGLRDASDQGESPKVGTIHTISDKENKPAFYIINYDKGGYIILSADIRMGPVLSISEIGFFEISDDYPEGLQSWMVNVKESIEVIRAGNNEADVIQKQVWETLLSDGQYNIETRKGGDTPLEYLKVTELKHIMKLKWNHHGDGYNDSVPLSCPGKPGGKAYVGCVPVTVGQILRHWQYPESYEWDKMPTTYSTPTTAGFLAGLGEDLQVYYTCNRGTSSYIDIGYALRTIYGYNATNDNRYTFEELKSEIDAGRPVVLDGPAILHDGSDINHAWICEGYMEYLPGISSRFSMDDESRRNIDISRRLLYMNWGWNEYNGWYSNDKLINGAGRFYINLMIKNIYPLREERIMNDERI